MAVVDGEATAKPEMNLTYVCMSISRIAINGIRADAAVCFTRHGKTFHVHISKNINSAIQKKKKKYEYLEKRQKYITSFFSLYSFPFILNSSFSIKINST